MMKSISLVRMGRMLRFNEVVIGQPFFAHNAFWVRVDREAAAKLMGTDWIGAPIRNFVCDSPEEQGEDVEHVTVVRPEE